MYIVLFKKPSHLSPVIIFRILLVFVIYAATLNATLNATLDYPKCVFIIPIFFSKMSSPVTTTRFSEATNKKTKNKSRQTRKSLCITTRMTTLLILFSLFTTSSGKSFVNHAVHGRKQIYRPRQLSLFILPTNNCHKGSNTKDLPKPKYGPFFRKIISSRKILPILTRGGYESRMAIPTTNKASMDENNSLERRQKMKSQVAVLSSFTVVISALIYINRQSIASFNFQEFLSEKLDILSDLGTPGLVLYVLSLVIWEVTMGITTPVETAAGMAFGFKRGIVANAFGKISGAIIAFLLGRNILKDYVTSKLENNEYMDLVQHSIRQRPLRVALIWRFSFLPEFVKNFGLAVLPIKTWQFVCAVLMHGLPFTVLWTFLGNEMGLVVKGVVSEPSRLLKMMISAVYIFGFFISPSLVGVWIKGLRDEKQKRESK